MAVAKQAAYRILVRVLLGEAGLIDFKPDPIQDLRPYNIDESNAASKTSFNPKWEIDVF